MVLKLTKEQAREVTLDYIRENQDDYTLIKEVLLACLSGLYSVPWSWMQALQDCVTFCSKMYCTKIEYIKKDLK